jgi:hypothetical protein
VQWELTEVYTLPLEYPTALPDGVYTEQVTGELFTYDQGGRLGSQARAYRNFQVIAGSLEPMRGEDFAAYKREVFPRDSAGNYIPASRPSPYTDPCPGFSVPSDAAPSEEAVSVVNFGEWVNAASFQPLRIELAARRLAYQTVSASGQVLYFALDAPADLVSGESRVSLKTDSSLTLMPFRLGSRNEVWMPTAGSAWVHALGDGRIAVELSDVVLENSDGLQQTLGTGSIEGSWIESADVR